MPTSVTMTIVSSNPPLMRSTTNMPASTSPNRNSREDALISVWMWLKMVPSASSPLFLKPIMAMKNPIPAAIAYFNDAGIISKIICLRLLMQSSTKSTPSNSTAVRANCQLYPNDMHIVSTKNKFSASPGACPKGRLAKKAINSVPMMVAKMVEVSSASIGKPCAASGANIMGISARM